MNGSVVPLGKPRPERADAARNRELLLANVREMLAAGGAGSVTMDALAERAQLGKGTVFRRFGTRAGIFRALLDADERSFQEQVLYGPPPLGPGASALDRMVAYGQARIAFLLDHHSVARAALDRNQPAPAGEATITRVHLRMLLGQAGLNLPDLDTLAVQLTGALEGPLLLYVVLPEPETPPSPAAGRPLAESWSVLVHRLLRAEPGTTPG
ncbi:TetR/AcrR family transcriptional regulator [Actinospica durhamensis]|uniref:TetR/AcrR family transcriptional regulator n=1 Tax=Actinospica durhamensis TaxID=1508375 RepID=A0A941IMW3_9ACTN|nr:TetR/AcrR family transcriptional regulator [Actinospica durhamensis]MBR7833294.1 TetR/AcrR family transcriptional regulator [Actinospica durhamensis]